MHRDGRDGARARSARIRATHDYEATQLDSMRRRTPETGDPGRRIDRVLRLAAVFGRLRRSSRGFDQLLAENETAVTAGT
jgi:hypothetical protein